METATVEVHTTAMRQGRSFQWSSLLLSGLFCVVLPVVFWLAAVGVGAWLLAGTTLSVAVYSAIGAGVAVVLVPVWASLFISKR